LIVFVDANIAFFLLPRSCCYLFYVSLRRNENPGSLSRQLLSEAEADRYDQIEMASDTKKKKRN
jgi:hypothetical protein